MPRQYKSVTRSELARRLRDSLPLLSDDERALVVETILDAMAGALADCRRIEIRDFGVFELRRRNAREARNPKTGRTMWIAAKVVPFFKAGRELQRRVNDARPADVAS